MNFIQVIFSGNYFVRLFLYQETRSRQVTGEAKTARASFFEITRFFNPKK